MECGLENVVAQNNCIAYFTGLFKFTKHLKKMHKIIKKLKKSFS